MTPIRVLLADHHSLFREGLASLLAAEKDFEVVGEAVDGLQALEMARELMPDLILMDISLPVMSGQEATRRIKAEMPYVKIVILTVSDCESCPFEAVKSGAEAYLPLGIEPRALSSTLRRVVQGEAPVSRVMAAQLLEEFARWAGQPTLAVAHAAELTAREREVLEQVARGGSNEAIAAGLAVAEDAVQNHLKNVLEKLHLESRVHSAALTLR